MRICIITIVGGLNLGNRLQNYALQKALNRFLGGVKVETVLYDHKKFCNMKMKSSWTAPLKEKIKYLFNFKKYRQRYKWFYERLSFYQEFNGKYINASPYTMEKGKLLSPQINDLYDYFIVGSDQVWHPEWISGNEDKFFLLFASKEKRIAYAASFGLPQIPEEKREIFYEGINGISYISVRENQGAKIIKKLTGRDVPVVVDPTLLLDKTEWCQIEKKPKWDVPNRYVLNYFLGDIPEEIQKDMREQAKKYGMEIISIYDINDPNCRKIGPSEFIYLIHHCNFMYTDSFHGTVFSILMRKPFYVINRVQEGMGSMNSRIDTLLQLFSFSERYLKAEAKYQHGSDIFDIDFNLVGEIQKKEWKRSSAYLRGTMNIEGFGEENDTSIDK